MQADEQKIHAVIFKALNNLNEELEPERKVPVSADTQLFGVDASLDSLSLVSVIVDVETEISSQFGRSISLTDDRALSSEVSPFTNVATLTEYILKALREEH